MATTSARQGSTNSSLHHRNRSYNSGPGRSPEITERHVVGALLTCDHRGIARGAARHAQDPFPTQGRPGGLDIARSAPKMDPVGAHLKGEPEMVAYDEGGGVLRAQRL